MLIVNDFEMKHFNKKDTKYLLCTLKNYYKVEIDWTNGLHYEITLDWN